MDSSSSYQLLGAVMVFSLDGRVPVSVPPKAFQISSPLFQLNAGRKIDLSVQ